MKQGSINRKRKGFLMMEVVLAIGIFAIAATSFAVAIYRISDTANSAQRQMKITRVLQSALNEYVSIPRIEEMSESVILDELISGAEVTVETEIVLMPEMENQDGELLQDMYHIEVRARWFEEGDWQEEIAETWRYGQLYQQ